MGESDVTEALLEVALLEKFLGFNIDGVMILEGLCNFVFVLSSSGLEEKLTFRDVGAVTLSRTLIG